MPFKIKNKSPADYLLTPWAILIGAAVGLYIGWFKKEAAFFIAPVGDIYLSVLSMSILPILLTAVTAGLGWLIQSEAGGGYLKRIGWSFLASLMVVSLIGTLVGLVGKPGKLKQEALSSLGVVVKNSAATEIDVSLSEPQVLGARSTPFSEFLLNIVPANIFDALSRGSSLKVLFFSIMFGLAIGFSHAKYADQLFPNLDAIHRGFTKIVQWLMYLLPFGLCGLISKQVALLSKNTLLAMLNFITVLIIGSAVAFLLCAVVVWLCRRRAVGLSFFGAIAALRESLTLAVATSNSLACLPSMLKEMVEKLKFEQQTMDLLVPLGITVCRHGGVLYYAAASVFVAQLYNIPLGFEEISIVFIVSIFAGIATAGATGVVNLTMLGLVLKPLGLPLEAVLVLFIVIDPIAAPLRVLINVYSVCAATAVISPGSGTLSEEKLD